MAKTLNAGWSTRNITPHGEKVSLAGQYYERLATEVDCDLTATALAMDNGEHSITWVSCDLASISSILSEDVRTVVQKRAPAIDSAHIFISATHTHTAPYIKKNTLPGAAVRCKPAKGVLSAEEYHDFVVEKIVDAVIEANSGKISNCTIQTGVSSVTTGCCRRGIITTGEAVMYIDSSRDDFVRMEYPNGGPCNIMYIRDEKKRLRGIITSIPCTAQVLEHQFYISSDYIGRVRKMLKDKYGEELFYLPLISSAGDCSPRNLVTKDYGFGNMYDKEGADNMATRVYEAILAEEDRVVDTISDFSDFQVTAKRISLPGWIPKEEEYQWALSLKHTDQIKYDIKDYVQKGVEPYFRTPLALEQRVKTIIARYENRDGYKTIEFEICAARLGDTVWVSNPFELFQEYGNRMVAGSKAKSLWSIQLTYDGIGYFPTKEAALAGGYSGFILSSRADPFEAGDMLVKESISLADSLF